MVAPCLCSQATEAPEITLIAGPGIEVSGPDPGGTWTLGADAADSWTSFTPTFTNFTLGDGINSSRYLLVGKTVDVVWAIRFGATSTWTATAWQFGMPPSVTPYYGSSGVFNGHVVGHASMYDLSALVYYEGRPALFSATNTMQIRIGDDSGGSSQYLRQGGPITFASGDEVVARARFEVL